MYSFEKTKENEYLTIFELMRINMYKMQTDLGLHWNQKEIEANYTSKENFTIYRMDVFVGFISLEFYDTKIFIHTLQVVPAYQNGLVGYRVLKHLYNLAEKKSTSLLQCCVFENNPAKEMYLTLGFKEVSRKNSILKLELNIEEYNRYN